MVSQKQKTVGVISVIGGLCLLFFLSGCSNEKYSDFIGGMETEFENSEWVCIARNCSEWLEGDAWITKFCRPENNTLMCDVELDGKSYKTPLENINVDEVQSCGEYECVTEILARDPRKE